MFKKPDSAATSFDRSYLEIGPENNVGARCDLGVRVRWDEVDGAAVISPCRHITAIIATAQGVLEGAVEGGVDHPKVIFIVVVVVLGAVEEGKVQVAEDGGGVVAGLDGLQGVVEQALRGQVHR